MERAYLDTAADLIAAVQAARPKHRKKPPDEAPDRPAERWGGVVTWANAVWGTEHVKPWVAERAAVLAVENERLTDEIKALETELAGLGPLAVFAREPGGRNRVASYYPGDFGGQGLGAAGYSLGRARITKALLLARGFTAEVVGGPVFSIEVWSDAPEIAKLALGAWRLDDVRLLAATETLNLKVLFSPFFPYAGSWDWPESARETRDDDSFALHRANEDAHRALNDV